MICLSSAGDPTWFETKMREDTVCLQHTPSSVACRAAVCPTRSTAHSKWRIMLCTAAASSLVWQTARVPHRSPAFLSGDGHSAPRLRSNVHSWRRWRIGANAFRASLYAEAAHPSHPHRRAPPLRATAWEGRIHGTQTGMLRGVPRSARCVQRFDDSRNSAIHITYRVSLRSSSMGEPRDPLSKVVFFFVGRYDPTH